MFNIEGWGGGSAPLDYAPEEHDEPATNTLADQIMGAVILFVVILALIGGATIIKGLVS